MRLRAASATASEIGVGLVAVLLGIVAVVCGPARRAMAAVAQPTGEAMPNLAPLAEINIATGRGFAADAGTLEGLFKYRGELLDPRRDAQTSPGTFSPMCRFTGQLVLRGGGCHVGFGWYNVTPNSTTPPPPSQIYELVPAQLPACPMPIVPTQACCDDTEFCPLATDVTTQAPQHRSNSPTFSADNIVADPRYRGGLIGFAMIGDASSQCSQTKFSQAELNTSSPAGPPTNGAPWITVLVYQSIVTPTAYYLAFEDLPVTTATWRGNGGNDGDFNDFVYYITGLNCDGGGKSCDTGMMGVCAGGTTQCTNGTSIVCKPDVPASTEICDGLDNDCDGVVDQGNPCTGANQICDRGVCVNQCNDTEFPCLLGFQCDQGYCKDPRCLGINCPVGQVCVAGACQGGCDGVVCPHGQACRIGRCIDPCAGVTCLAGDVCEGGACVPQCSCRPCSAGLACAADGRCVDAGCEMMSCGAGLVCVGGACMDPCDTGTMCPAGQTCSTGGCVETPLMGTGGTVGTRFDAGAVGGRSGGAGTGARSGVDSGVPGDPGMAPGNGVAKCGCDVGGQSAGLFSALSLLIAAGILTRRRSRR
jgi:hypothetical protein